MPTRVTESMRRAIEETRRRRESGRRNTTRQHGITPETIRKAIRSGIEAEAEAHVRANAAVGRSDDAVYITEEYIQELEAEMYAAAESLEFERAGALRDRIGQMRDSIGKTVGEVDVKSSKPGRGQRRKHKGRSLPRPKKGV